MACEHGDSRFLPKSIREVDEERRLAHMNFRDPMPIHMTPELVTDIDVRFLPDGKVTPIYRLGIPDRIYGIPVCQEAL